jgi:hypothetical protein
MSNIITAHIKIQGVRPLLWNAFTPEAIPLQKQEKTGVAGNDPEEWKKTVLITKDRQLYVEPTYIFGCLRDGAKHTKKGRGSIQSLVASTLQIVDDRIQVDRFLPEEVDPRSRTAGLSGCALSQKSKHESQKRSLSRSCSARLED